MTLVAPPPAMRPLGPPLRAIPQHFSAACLIGTLLTDITYVQTTEIMWSDFSAWLLFAGLLLAGLAALCFIVDLFRRRLPLWGMSWLYILLNAVVFALAFLNALVHARDAWASVMPWGLGLSVVTVVIILLTSILGSRVERRYAERI